MSDDVRLREAVRWLNDLADGRVPPMIPTVAQLRQYAASIERDLAVRAQLRADGPPTLVHLGTVRSMMMPEMSDIEVAGEARMLTPMEMTPAAFLRGGKPLDYYCVLVRDRILHLSQRLAALGAWHPMDTAPAPEGFIDDHPQFFNERPTIWVRYAHDDGLPIALILGRLHLEEQQWRAERWRPLSLPASLVVG